MKRFDLTARFLSLSVLVVMNAGCVSTSLYLASNHPARIDAPSGPAHSDPAAILHPDAPLYPSEGLFRPVEGENPQHEQAEAANAQNRTPDGTREAPYVGQGVIQGIRDGQLEIRHGEIPGLMGAMQMIFPVAPEAMNDSLEVGNEILFRIEVRPEGGYQIFSIEVLPVDQP